MSIVNTDKILYGSDQKVFDHAYNMMMSDYNENTASDFFESYKNKSLLFILKNSEKIIKEPEKDDTTNNNDKETKRENPMLWVLDKIIKFIIKIFKRRK